MEKRQFFQLVLTTLLCNQVPMPDAIAQAKDAVAAWEKF